MIRKFIRDTIADLAHAVARSELVMENALLRAKMKELEAANEKLSAQIQELTYDDRDDLRAKLEAAERRQPVDRERALSVVYAFLVDHWRGCNAGRYSVELVDAILGAKADHRPADREGGER